MNLLRTFHIRFDAPLVSVQRGWMKYFLLAAGAGIGVAGAQERTMLNYWWVMPQKEEPRAPRVLRVIGEKGSKYEQVDYGDSKKDAAVRQLMLERQAMLRQKALLQAQELRKDGKSPELAYEEAWATVYKQHWLNANWGEGSSQLEDMLSRLAAEEEGFELTDEETQWLLEALLEDDARMEGDQGRALLQNLAQRLRSMGYGRMNLTTARQDELMMRFADAMGHGKDSMSAFRDALFKTNRGSIMQHQLVGFYAPWGMGMGGKASYRQAPLKVSSTVASGNTQPVVLPSTSTSFVPAGNVSAGGASNAGKVENFLATAPSVQPSIKGSDDVPGVHVSPTVGSADTPPAAAGGGAAGGGGGGGLSGVQAGNDEHSAGDELSKGEKDDQLASLPEKTPSDKDEEEKDEESEDDEEKEEESALAQEDEPAPRMMMMRSFSMRAASPEESTADAAGETPVMYATAAVAAAGEDKFTKYIEELIRKDKLKLENGGTASLHLSKSPTSRRPERDKTVTWDAAKQQWTGGKELKDKELKEITNAGILAMRGTSHLYLERGGINTLTLVVSNEGEQSAYLHAETQNQNTVMPDAGLHEFGLLQGRGRITFMGDVEGKTTIYQFNGVPAATNDFASTDLGFHGELAMAGSCASRVQLNISGAHWQNAYVNLTPGSGSAYNTSGTAAGTVLNILGDTQLLGLTGGNAEASTVTSNSGALSYTLTLGDASGVDYTYAGGFNGDYYTSDTSHYASTAPLNLTKIHDNTQVMTADATGSNSFNVVTVNGGQLEFSQSLQAASAVVNAGELSVGGYLHITETYSENEELCVSGAGSRISVAGDVYVADDASVLNGGTLTASNLSIADTLTVNSGQATIADTVSAQSVRVYGGGSLVTHNLQDISNSKLVVEVGNNDKSAQALTSTLVVTGNLEADTLRLRSDGKLVTGESSNTISESHLHGGAQWVLEGSDNYMTGLMKVEDVSSGTVNFMSESGTAVLTMPGTISFADAGWTDPTTAAFTLDGVTLDFSRGVTLTNLGFGFGNDSNTSFVLASITGTGGYNDGYLENTSLGSIMVESNGTVYHANLTLDGSNLVVNLEHTLGNDPFQVENGQVVYIEMKHDASSPALPYSAYTKAGYTGSWIGSSVDSDHLLQFSNVVLHGGGALYLGENAGGSAADRHFGGKIQLNAEDTAASLHGMIDEWGNWLLDGRLSGNGTLQLVAHHGIGTRGETTQKVGNAATSEKVITTVTRQYGVASTFTFTDASSQWMSGTLSLAANAGTADEPGGIVQLNIGNVNIAGKGDNRWRNTVIDLTSSPYIDPDSVVTSKDKSATELVLGLMGDATIAGLKGDENASVVSNIAEGSNAVSPTLTVGSNEQDYTFAGTLGSGNFYTGGQASRVETTTDTYGYKESLRVQLSSTTTAVDTNMVHMAEGRLSLTKVGSNKQSFTGSAHLDAVAVQGGTLELMGNTVMNSLNMSSGTTLNTGSSLALGSATLDGATMKMGGVADIETITLTNGAKVTSASNAALGMVTLRDATTTMTLTGKGTSIEALTLGAGTKLVTGSNVTLGSAVLYGGANWQLGGDLNMSSSPITMVDAAGTTFNITSSGAVTWNTMSYLNFAGNSAYSETTPLFTLGSGVTLNLSDTLTLANVQGLQENSSMALFKGVSNAPDFTDKQVFVSDAAGNTYFAEYKYSNGTVFLDIGLKTNTGILIGPEGYIWSGENTGYTNKDEDYQGIAMGNVWRADGSATHTGWHEQRADASVSPGVYVNGNTVTFRDTDVHGADEKHREVYIYGKVAPGKIYVSANNDAGFMGKGDAELKYGYAFTGHQDSPNAGIIDYVDEDGNLTRTSITKTGDAVLILNTANDFTGGIEVKDGSLYLSRPYSSGTGPISLYVDCTWDDYWDKTGTDSGFETIKRTGAELMVNYEHNHDEVSAYRNPVVQNTIILKTGSGENGSNPHATISYARAAYESKNVNDDFSNVPRHWRNLTITGGLYGDGDLVLRGYTSCWDGGHDQCYISAFTINHSQLDMKLIESLGMTSELKAFTGTVTLKNTVNTSLLNNDNVGARTGGGVQLTLSDDTFAHGVINLTREEGTKKESVTVDGKKYEGYRQSYTNILVVNGDVSVGALSGDFLGDAWVYTRNGEDYTRKFQTISEKDERWRLRVVTGSETTLRLGREEDGATTYVYDGAMGYAQSYTQPQQAHISFGDGFETLSDVAGYNKDFRDSGSFSNGTTTLSLVKSSQTQQYIHTAWLNDVSLYKGMLGFNNLELQGNLNLVANTDLKLGATTEAGWSATAGTADSSIAINANKTLTVITPNKETVGDVTTPITELNSARVTGDISMNAAAALTFISSLTPDSLHESVITKDNAGSITPLLDIEGTLTLNPGQTINLSFDNINFSLNQKYYIARADVINIVGGENELAFGTQTVTLGYGYFGTLYTVGDNGSSLGDGDTAGSYGDYLVMQVTGDPRRTWSGMVSMNGNNYTWSAGDNPMDRDYRWKENLEFVNGHVVLFGNLNVPTLWTESSTLGSEDTVNVDKNNLQPGTLVDKTGDKPLYVDDFSIDSFSIKELSSKLGEGYQAVKVNGEVAPFMVMINANYEEYVKNGDSWKLSQAQQTDGTNYYFYTTEGLNGTIRDATPEELDARGFDTTWKTMVHKTGTGTTVMALDNRYTGGTILQGGTMVMQHVNALGYVYEKIDDTHGRLTGNDCTITLMNGAALQGDFDDDDFAGNYNTDGNLSQGKAMATTTINNKVVVNVYADPNNAAYNTEVDGRLINSGNKKLIIAQLEGESDTVLLLNGVSLTRDEAARRAIERYAAKDDYGNYLRDEKGNYLADSGEVLELDRYNYGVFKVLDPGKFYGTVTMCGHVWGESEHGGGNVQLDIMSTNKSNDGADWTNATVDLTVQDGTLRTVLALDVMSSGEICELNSITGSILTEGGSSSVLNMSRHNAATLQLTGTRSGKYEGVLGYGDFQVAVNYGGYTENQQGTTQHHYGAIGEGSLNVIKMGDSTVQEVRRAWLNRLEVQGGQFVVNEALVAHEIASGGGKRVIVGAADPNTLYALAVGKGGILAMNTTFAEEGRKQDAWEELKPGVDNAAYVRLEDGATLSAREDWYTIKPIDFSRGAGVTVNTRNYAIDPHLKSEFEKGNDVFGKYTHSHIIQLLGTMSGMDVALTFNNRLIDPVTAEVSTSDSPYMGYAAINDFNVFRGTENTLEVESMTVLQILQDNAGVEGDIDVHVEGKHATLQILDKVVTYDANGNATQKDSMVQYIDHMTFGANLLVPGEDDGPTTGANDPLHRPNNGQLLLGGAEVKTLAPDGTALMQAPDMADMQILVSSRHNTTELQGEVSHLHVDLRGASAKLGGADGHHAEMKNTHIDVARSDINHAIHHTDLVNSLVHLQEDCSVNIADVVLLDRDSAVSGVVVDYDAATVSPTSDPLVAAGLNPTSKTKEVTTSVQTMVEMTFNENRGVYQAGNSNILVLQAEQFLGVDVTGNGLTLQLTEESASFLDWGYNAGAEYVAVMIGGGSGHFLYETDNTTWNSNFEDLIDSQFVLLDSDGEQIVDCWVSSAYVSTNVGTKVTPYMIYFKVPEPATTTLSLLALTALCARRRRK
ncbi:MAG: hypothetical protein IKW48_06770 [Akkermansia sp.]|nr:hypothetical protein [Akkermansia sp.]